MGKKHVYIPLKMVIFALVEPRWSPWSQLPQEEITMSLERKGVSDPAADAPAVPAAPAPPEPSPPPEEAAPPEPEEKEEEEKAETWEWIPLVNIQKTMENHHF